MSLEAKIELLTAAATELTRAISNARLVAPVSVKMNPYAGEQPLRIEKLAPGEKKEDLQLIYEIKHRVTAADTKENRQEGESLNDTKERLQKDGPNEPESSTQKSAEPSAQTGESSSSGLTYKDHVKPATLKLSQQKGRDIAVAVLARFGVKGAQDLDESQWADYVAHVDKVLAGGEV